MFRITNSGSSYNGRRYGSSSVAAGTETELVLDLPGELAADFTPDADALLVWHTYAARTRLHRFDLATGALTELETAPGCVGSARVRPDGSVEY